MSTEQRGSLTRQCAEAGQSPSPAVHSSLPHTLLTDASSCVVKLVVQLAVKLAVKLVVQLVMKLVMQMR